LPRPGKPRRRLPLLTSAVPKEQSGRRLGPGLWMLSLREGRSGRLSLASSGAALDLAWSVSGPHPSSRPLKDQPMGLRWSAPRADTGRFRVRLIRAAVRSGACGRGPCQDCVVSRPSASELREAPRTGLAERLAPDGWRRTAGAGWATTATGLSHWCGLRTSAQPGRGLPMRGKQCCAGVCATYLSSQALPTQRALQLQFLTSTASDPFRVNAITDEVAARLVGAEHSDDTIAHRSSFVLPRPPSGEGHDRLPLMEGLRKTSPSRRW
jgi:hypothetical protein